jgi:hypothetical protein
LTAIARRWGYDDVLELAQVEQNGFLGRSTQTDVPAGAVYPEVTRYQTPDSEALE